MANGIQLAEPTASVVEAGDRSDPSSRSPGSSRHRAPRWFVRGAQLLILVLILGGWQYLSSTSHPATPLAGPWEVATTLVEWSTDPEFWQDVYVTLKEAVIGWVIGSAAGVVVAYAFAFIEPLARLLTPIIAALNALPKITLAPLFIVWFGTATESKVAFVVSVVFFVVFYTVFSGLRSIDRSLVINARILGASRFRMLRDVYGPAAFGWLMSSLRLSTTLALLLAVVGEFVASQEGIGNTIAIGQQRFRSNVVLAGIVVVAVLALVLDRLLVLVEKRLGRWKVS